MIYETNFLKKELRQSYIATRNSNFQTYFIAFLLGLTAVVIHTILLTVENSVVTDVYPFLVSDSLYGVLFIYTVVSYLYFIIYFIQNYRFVTFAEIMQNRWYMLRKMGFSSVSMILAKMASTFYIVLKIYSIGFVLTIILSGIFNYSISWASLISLYASGLLNAVCFAALTMVLSLFFNQIRNAASIIVIIAAFFVLIRHFTIHSQIVIDESIMGNIFNLAISPTVWLELILTFLSIVICIIFAQKKSRTYTIKSSFEFEFFKDFRTNKISRLSRHSYNLQKFFSTLLTMIVFIIVIIGCAFNVMLFLLSSQSASNEFAVGGYIPYIMQTETMNGALEVNDLALFKRPEQNHPYQKEDVVLIDAGAETGTIEKIVDLNDVQCIVDVNNYPEGIIEGALRYKLNLADIRGYLVWRSRPLGALILFANSNIGRLLMLVVPLMVLFFYDQISKVSAKLEKSSGRVQE